MRKRETSESDDITTETKSFFYDVAFQDNESTCIDLVYRDTLFKFPVHMRMVGSLNCRQQSIAVNLIHLLQKSRQTRIWPSFNNSSVLQTRSVGRLQNVIQKNIESIPVRTDSEREFQSSVIVKQQQIHDDKNIFIYRDDGDGWCERNRKEKDVHINTFRI